MASTRSLIRTESCGPSNMKHFSDRGDITNINTTAISRIVVTHDDFIRSLTVGLKTVLVRNLLMDLRFTTLTKWELPEVELAQPSVTLP